MGVPVKPLDSRMVSYVDGLGDELVLTELAYYWVLQYRVATPLSTR